MSAQSTLSVVSDRFTRIIACSTSLVSTAVIIHGQTFGYEHMTPCIWPLIASFWATAWLVKSRQWNTLASKTESHPPCANRSLNPNHISASTPRMKYSLELQKAKSPD